MKHIKALLGVSALAAAMALAGCSSGGDAGATPSTNGSSANAGATKKAITITMIAKSSTNPVFMAAKTGAEQAAKDIKEKQGVDVTIDWQTPETEDGQVQAQRIQQAVNQHSDAILVSCSDATKVTGAINDAVGRGVEVMTFDSDAPDSKRFAFYGVDDIETGKRVMDELAKQIDGKGKVAILAGNQNAPNLQKRVQGVKDAAKAYPGVTIVDVVNHVETPEDASAAVTREMNAHPEITAWAMVGGWPLFAKSLLSELPAKHVRVVSVDALPIELPYVEAGIAPLLLAQPVYNWGYISVEKIVDHVVNKKPVDTINKMELVPVTKETLGDWARQLQKWGFTDVDPKYLEMKGK